MRRRVLFSVTLSLFLILLGWGVISYVSVKQSIDNSIQKRLELAELVSNYIDYIIEENIKRLYDISTSYRIDFTDNNWEPEKKALKNVYQYSIFTEGVFFLDLYGNLILSYPPRPQKGLNLTSIPYVGRIISEKRPLVSNVYTIEPQNRKVIYLLTPLKDRQGDVIGVSGGIVDLTTRVLSEPLTTIHVSPEVYIEMVDSNGIIIASNRFSRILTLSDHNRFLSNLIINRKSSVGMCHRCHFEGKKKTKDVMAFVPLKKAPWGVLIREPQEVVLAPASALKRGFLLLGIITIATSVLLTVGITKGVLRPVEQLIKVTRRIGEGDLSARVEYSGSDEIGELARSFEQMRQRLATSLEYIKKQNIELERRVKERTRQLEESQRKIASLLRQVINTQEEERKRIARELHDETMQELSAFLMRLEYCRLYPESITDEKIDEMKNMVIKILDGIRNTIQNLRPTVLDDLGLEAGIRWLLERNLKDKGINYFLTIKGDRDRRLEPQMEITLFRIIQEAIMNIAKHSEAENVYVVIKNSKESIEVDIEDDGKGFNVEKVLGDISMDGRGLGLLGMKERASLFDGELNICSSEGMGTRVSLRFPIKRKGVGIDV